MDNETNIYDTVKDQIATYESGVGVPVAGNWNFSLYNHSLRTMLMKNGEFPVNQIDKFDPKNNRPVRNIILPIIEVAHRAEDFDVKDIEIYVDNADNYHLSLLARKFYHRWALKHNLDGFIDDVVESYDYGFSLVKNVNNERPEVIEPQQIAYVDQTDILSGTICLKHQYSIDQLKDMEKQGWYKDEIDVAIAEARKDKPNAQTPGQPASVPDKHIEVFEVHGTFPETWLKKNNDEAYDNELDGDKYSKQLHIITFLKGENDTKTGICLFKGPEKQEVFKVSILNKIYGRCAGRGRVEELFDSQIWTNFNLIQMQDMLKQASKVFYQTADAGYTTRNNTKNIKGGEVFVHEDGKPATPVNTQPINFNLFDRAFQEWEQHARTTGSASDPSLGLNPVSGTPLGTTQIVTQQGLGRHERNRGKIASFIEEIHRDWIMDYLVAEMNKGDEWLDELSLDELQVVAENGASNSVKDLIKKMTLTGQIVTEEDQMLMKEIIKQDYQKSGSKKFLKIMKDEFSKIPLNIHINVANKQKDLGRWSEKMGNIFRAIFANPQGFVATMQIPSAAKSFNEMLEASGMSPIDYTQLPSIESMQPPETPTPSPTQQPNTAQLANNQ